MYFLPKNLLLLATAFLIMISLSGCDRRTPDERLATAFQFFQQGDLLSAEMEAVKVIEKAPKDPASIQASMLLARIYATQGRFDEAEMQLASTLDDVSQLDKIGKDILQMYLALLTNQKKYDEALETVNKYQKEYAEDPGTSISLRVAGANIQTMAGRTAAARTTLQGIMDETTGPAEMAIYRGLYVGTFMRDDDSTGAIDYLEATLPALKRSEDRRKAMSGLASLYGAEDNYAKSRFYLREVTDSFMSDIRKELDSRAKIGLVLQMGQTYMMLGNRLGARRILQTLYESNLSDPRAAMVTVSTLAENLLRMGETSATESLLQDAAKKYPEVPFAQQLDKLQSLIASGEMQVDSARDTSTLTMKYREDGNILWPEDLPEVLGVAGDARTSDTVTNTSGTDAMTTSSGPSALPPLEEQNDARTSAPL